MKTKNDLYTVSKVADRAIALRLNIHKDKMSLFMDIEFSADDANMDLDKLLSFDDFNFTHDLAGIQANLNRESKKIENCFSPRCART